MRCFQVICWANYSFFSHVDGKEVQKRENVKNLKLIKEIEENIVYVSR